MIGNLKIGQWKSRFINGEFHVVTLEVVEIKLPLIDSLVSRYEGTQTPITWKVVSVVSYCRLRGLRN